MTNTEKRMCDCGKAIRGNVPQVGIDLPSGIVIDVPAHFCLQCSDGHCKMRDFCVKNGALRYGAL